MIHWVLASGALDVIAFSIKTGTTTSTKKVILGNWTTPYDCIVDWGDGSTTKVTSNTQITHAYESSSTTYQIKIIGKCGGFWNGSTRLSGYALVTSLDEVRSNSLKSLYYTFYNCTQLATLPATLDAPNIVDFSYAFYQCRSVTSALPALWLSHPNAAHAGCFTDCFKSLYGQYGTGCSSRRYVPSVAGQTYYQHYGQSGCPALTEHTTSQKTYYQQYGGETSCPRYMSSWSASRCRCPSCLEWTSCVEKLDIGGCQDFSGSYNHWGNTTRALTCPSCGYVGTFQQTAPRCDSTCKKVYSNASVYYSCSYYGTNCKGSGCTRTYTSGQSAYYKCTKSNATCSTTNCPYPYANEADVNAAKAAGWA